jgi:hypothetical protein
MEQVRNARLDHLCEDIGDNRDAMNAARASEQEAVAGALAVMHRDKISVYKHGGIELARVPGSEKLRVRLVKDQGNADVGTGTTTAENAGDGDGDDAGEGAGDDE